MSPGPKYSREVKLAAGLYEELMTSGLEQALRELQDEIAATREDVTEDGGPHLLARLVHDALLKALRELPRTEAFRDKTKAERVAGQVALANTVIRIIAESVPGSGLGDDELVPDPAQMLLGVRRLVDARLGTGEMLRPTLPLRQSDLLVNGPRDLRLGHELRREIASADAIDVIVSFVKWTGLRLIHKELADFAARRPGRLRFLTTTYLGASEPRAIEALTWAPR